MKELSPVGEFFAESGGSPPLESIARTFATDRLPDLLADLARAQAIVLTRLITPIQTTKNEEADQLLTASEAATFLNWTPVAVRRSAKLRPYRKVLGPRSIRWSRDGLIRFMNRAAA